MKERVQELYKTWNNLSELRGVDLVAGVSDDSFIMSLKSYDTIRLLTCVMGEEKVTDSLCNNRKEENPFHNYNRKGEPTVCHNS